MNNEEQKLDQSKIPEMIDKAEEAYKTYLVESGVRFSILNEKIELLIKEINRVDLNIGSLISKIDDLDNKVEIILDRTRGLALIP